MSNFESTIIKKAPILDTAGAKDTDYKVTLTINTATQVPESANVPAYDYVLILSNRSDTAMVHGNSTGIIVSAAIDKGTVLDATNGKFAVKMKANTFLRVACAGIDKQLDYTIYSIGEPT